MTTRTSVAEMVQMDRASMSVPYVNSTMERWKQIDLSRFLVVRGTAIGVYVYQTSYHQQQFDLEFPEITVRRTLSEYSDDELRRLYSMTSADDIEIADEDIHEYVRSLLRLDEE